MQLIRGKHKDRSAEILDRISEYESAHNPLIGIKNTTEREVWVKQIISSIRRVEYIHEIQKRDICKERSDPSSPIFDPLRAAILASRSGEYEQAVWLVFFATNFGKHGRDGWKLMRNIYGSFGLGPNWIILKI